MSPRVQLTIFAVLLTLAVVSLSYHSDPARQASFPRRVMMEGLGMAQEGLESAARDLENMWTSYFYLVGLQANNRELRREADRLRGNVVALREQKLANQRLLGLLNFATEHDFPFLGARVVGWDPGPWFKTVVIDRGTSDGLSIGMPVINDLGVVGRVMEVSPRYARVLLITDYNSSIPAMIQKNRMKGVLAGRSEHYLTMKYVEKTEELDPEDLVVTSGMGGVFPKGLPLGTIRAARKAGHDMYMVIEVEPLVDFSRIEEVLVITTKPPVFLGGLSATDAGDA